MYTEHLQNIFPETPKIMKSEYTYGLARNHPNIHTSLSQLQEVPGTQQKQPSTAAKSQASSITVHA